MNCPKCGETVPEKARFCPHCGAGLPVAALPSATHIEVGQEVGTVEDGRVVGLQLGEVEGDLSIESTVNQFENTFVQGDVVDQQHIYNVTLALGEGFLDALVDRLVALQGVDKTVLQRLSAQPVPEQVNQQIAQVLAAQKEAAARGMAVSPQTFYRLGLLAAQRRDYEEALLYLRQATQADPNHSDAFEAIVRMQQSRAVDDIQRQDYDAAVAKLAEAHTAATHTDPLDHDALVLRGYIAKTLAQIAGARGEQEERQKYYQEAARFFKHVVQLTPEDPPAHNGLGNVAYALGELDQAVAAYRRAIELAPNYTAAHHDLAIALEAKMGDDPDRADEWCRQALRSWQRAYELAPTDPSFSADRVLIIGQQVARLKRRCGNGEP